MNGPADFLNGVGGILGLQSPAAAPGVDERTVQPDKARPGVRLLGLEALQQARRC